MASWSNSELQRLIDDTTALLRDIGGEEALNEELSYYGPKLRESFPRLNHVYVRMCDSIRNTAYMRMVINDVYFARMEPELLHINLHDIATAPDPLALARLSQIIDTTCSVSPSTQENKKAWKIFKQGAVDGSRYLTKYRDTGEFYAYIDSHSSTAQDALKLAGELDQIKGIGLALACDFLKEIAVDRYGKPDRHIKELFKQLGLISGQDEDKQAFMILWQLSDLTNRPAVEVDKILWIAKSGRWDRTLDKRPDSRGLKRVYLDRQRRFDDLIADELERHKG